MLGILPFFFFPRNQCEVGGIIINQTLILEKGPNNNIIKRRQKKKIDCQTPK